MSFFSGGDLMSHPVQTTSPELIFPPGAERRRGSQGAGWAGASVCAPVRVRVRAGARVLFPADLKPAVISFLQLCSDTAPARGGSHDIDQ